MCLHFIGTFDIHLIASRLTFSLSYRDSLTRKLGDSVTGVADYGNREFTHTRISVNS